MTAKELITLLQAVPEDSLVLSAAEYGRFKPAKVSTREVGGPSFMDNLYYPYQGSETPKNSVIFS